MMAASEHDDGDAITQMRQQLNELRESGEAKTRRRQGEIEKFTSTRDQLYSKWKRACQKRPLHHFVKALTDENHLVPSKILSQQAKLAQCLQLMEVYMRQKTLVEKQNREYAELIAQQAGEQEELQSEITLELMNDLCVIDNEIRDIKKELEELGYNDKQELVEEEAAIASKRHEE